MVLQEIAHTALLGRGASAPYERFAAGKTSAQGRLRRPEHGNPEGRSRPSARGVHKKGHDLRRVLFCGARGGSRTRTPLRALAPEASESTNSTTRAKGGALFQRKGYISINSRPCQYIF